MDQGWMDGWRITDIWRIKVLSKLVGINVYGTGAPRLPIPWFLISSGTLKTLCGWFKDAERSWVFHSAMLIARVHLPFSYHPTSCPEPAATVQKPWPMHTHTLLPCALATCFKLLQDLNNSDPLHLKYIINKIKNMARCSPNMVLETIYDYFTNNPEVGAAGSLGIYTSRAESQHKLQLRFTLILGKSIRAGVGGGNRQTTTPTRIWLMRKLRFRGRRWFS